MITKATRRKMSLAAKRRCTAEWRKRKSEAFTLSLPLSTVRKMYAAGKTQAEIAAHLRVSQKAVWRFMRNNGIKARVAAKRDQWRERNSNWKRVVGYAGIHARVEVERGKPSQCGHCGTTDPRRHYDWACLNGDYTRTENFIRLCRSCHWKHDKKITNIRKGKR